MTQLTISTSFDALSRTETPVRAESPARSQETRHYRIGAVSVSLRSDLAGVHDDFHALYRTYRIDRAPSDAFQIDVVAKRSWRTGRKYFHVFGNGEELSTTQRPDDVVPHVEWVVNNLIARYLPGHLQLHASVMARYGVGVIFPGSPGQGKSTLAAGLLACGWSYLSDEFALINPDTQLLFPYPKALCIKAGSFDVVRGLGLPIDLTRVYRKGIKGRVAMLNPLAVRSDVVPESCPVGLVVFPEYGHGEPPVMEPLSRAQAVFELTRVSFNFIKFRRGGVDLLVDVVRRARCFRLRTGDLVRTCTLIERCLQDKSAEGAR